MLWIRSFSLPDPDPKVTIKKTRSGSNPGDVKKTKKQHVQIFKNDLVGFQKRSL